MTWLSDSRVDHLRSIVSGPDFSLTKYRIVKELARGGMGTVYLADDLELDRQIAIKVINAPEADAELVSRMIQEARIIARLEHPGIVPIHDVGTLADGRVFYAMKLVRGSRLDEYARENESIKDRLRKFQTVCDAVAFAHAHHVIHRDLKPQNIMIASFGEVLVLDWGVAKMFHNRETAGMDSEADIQMLPDREDCHPNAPPDNYRDTARGTVIGTAGYMSPEQLRGETEQLEERSDVYALGAVLYFLLTDRSPHSSNAWEGSSESRLPDPPSRPRELNPSVSKAAEAVCLHAMASAITDRYASAAELSADIAKLIDGDAVSAYRENIFERTGRWLDKNRFLVFLVLAYLLMRIFFLLTARR
jgi:serine/threonine protein kinase